MRAADEATEARVPAVHGPLKGLAIVVIAAMAAAMIYAAWITLTHWSGIGV